MTNNNDNKKSNKKHTEEELMGMDKKDLAKMIINMQGVQSATEDEI